MPRLSLDRYLCPANLTAVALLIFLGAMLQFGSLSNELYFEEWKNLRSEQDRIKEIRDRDVDNPNRIPRRVFMEDSMKQDYDVNNFFGIPELTTTHWVLSWGQMRPMEEYSTVFDVARKHHWYIGRMADLDLHVYDVKKGKRDREQWIYVTDSAGPSSTEWNKAFKSALSLFHPHDPKSTVPPNPVFIQCNGKGAFLCQIWAVQAPALLSIAFEEWPPTASDVQRSPHVQEDFRAVTVRVFEFPMKTAAKHLTPYDQLHSVMNWGDLYYDSEIYSREKMLARRYRDYALHNGGLKALCNRANSTQDWISGITRWKKVKGFWSGFLQEALGLARQFQLWRCRRYRRENSASRKRKKRRARKQLYAGRSSFDKSYQNVFGKKREASRLALWTLSILLSSR